MPKPDPMTTMRAARTLGDNYNDEKHRQRIGREALASALDMPALSGLVACSICGLLDDTDPCGDHEESSDSAGL